MNGFFARLEQLTGRPAPRRHVPYGAATALGALQWLWAELTGHPPQITHREVGVFREHMGLQQRQGGARAGYAPTPLLKACAARSTGCVNATSCRDREQTTETQRSQRTTGDSAHLSPALPSILPLCPLCLCGESGCSCR